jgi:SOS-response transcriptional repressor LexA
MTFGEALKKARGKMGQAALARAVDVDPSAISQVERGVRNTLSKEKVAAIEKALALPVGSLAKYLPKGHRAHDASSTSIPDMGRVWGSPPRDVPEPTPGKVFHLTGRFPPDTFALTVDGDSIHGYGVHDGDVIAVQPATDPEEGSLVVARQGNAYTIKAYIDGELLSFKRGEKLPVKLPIDEPFVMVGVMIGVIDGKRRAAPRGGTRGKPPAKKNK